MVSGILNKGEEGEKRDRSLIKGWGLAITLKNSRRDTWKEWGILSGLTTLGWRVRFVFWDGEYFGSPT